MKTRVRAVLTVLTALALTLTVRGQEIVQELRLIDLYAGRAHINRGDPKLIHGKVTQVIDANNVVVLLAQPKARDGELKFNTAHVFWLRCPTGHLKEGQMWSGGEWEKIIGTPLVQTTGTRLYERNKQIMPIPCIEPWRAGR